MKTEQINLRLFPNEIEDLDALVEDQKKEAFNPTRVNRSTVIRELIYQAKIKKESK